MKEVREGCNGSKGTKKEGRKEGRKEERGRKECRTERMKAKKNKCRSRRK